MQSLKNILLAFVIVFIAGFTLNAVIPSKYDRALADFQQQADAIQEVLTPIGENGGVYPHEAVRRLYSLYNTVWEDDLISYHANYWVMAVYMDMMRGRGTFTDESTDLIDRHLRQMKVDLSVSPKFDKQVEILDKTIAEWEAYKSGVQISP